METVHPDIDMDAAARRIADELVKLHEAGAIKSEQDASFYANLIHLFGASFTIRAGSYAPRPGSSSPEPGKPYTLTAAQRVKIPKELSRKQEAEFLLRDLEEVLAYESTTEELGESVIDLTGDVRSQSARTVLEPSPIAPRSSHKRLRTTRSTAGRSGVVAIDLRVT